MPLRGACGCWNRRAVVGQQNHLRGVQLRPNRLLRGAQLRPNRLLRGAQQARSAPRTNVRELFCGSKITRNDSDEAERRERSPPGVVSAANDEGLAGAARQVRGVSPAREWECFASQWEFRGERGGPEGGWPSGAIRIRHNNQLVNCNDAKRQTKLMSKCMITCDWKAELKSASPHLRAPHSKVDFGRHWIREMINDW